MAQFIGNRWVQTCETRFKKKADTPSLILIGLNISTKETMTLGFNIAKNSNDVLLYIRAIQVESCRKSL